MAEGKGSGSGWRCRHRSRWRKERQGRRWPCDFKGEEDESGGTAAEVKKMMMNLGF
uniref:Uncharacterized protein n=1 Tax=Cucumis melo TaxID=3656 RepID=A0A9I9EJ62_CUCME